MSSTMKNLFEGSVRTVTGDESYEFGDWTKKAVSDMTGKDASEYQFGDITKKAVTNFTGKDDYEFGDVTKKLVSNIFGKRKGSGNAGGKK